jgi:hypothetical protein
MVRKEFGIPGSVCLFLLFFFVILCAGMTFESASDQEGAVQLISNPKSPRPPDGKRKQILFREEVTIGVVEGDENYMFGNFIIFNTDDEGNFYITDWDRKRIQKYSPEGKFLLTIGKQGQGPGEFGNPSIVRFDKWNRIYVTDISNQRIHFFDRAGNFLEQIMIPDAFENLYINSKGLYVSSHTREAASEYGGMGFKLEWGIFDSQFKLVSEFASKVMDRKPPGGRDAASRAKFMGELLSDGKAYAVATENDYKFAKRYGIEIIEEAGK